MLNYIKHFLRPQGLETVNQPKGEKSLKHSNAWTLSSMLLIKECVNNEIKEEIKQFMKTNENEHVTV